MNFFRRHLESRATKIIALIIALIFVGWEFMSSMLKQPNTWLIKVGEIEYRAKDWQETYKSLTQDPMSAQEAIVNPQYAKKRVLDEMVRSALILQEAKAFGLRVNDKMAASEIIHMQMFKDENNTFDKNKLEEFLKNNSISEGEFIKRMKENILRNQFMDIFYNTSGIIGSPTFNLMLKLVSAEQNITIYKIPIIKEKIEPSDDDLKKFMNDHKDKFMTNDKAEISKIVFKSDLITPEKLKVSDEEIKDFYEKHSVVEPEKRSVNQIVISSHNDAKSVLEKIRSGKITYEEAANFYKQQQIIPYEIGPFVSEGFDEDIAKVVFNLPLSEVSDLVQTPLGWHIFKVKKIYEAKTKDLSQVKNEIIAKLTEKKLTEEMNKIVEKVMSEINSQLSITEIATRNNLQVEKSFEEAKKLPNGVIDTLSNDELKDGVSKKRLVTTAFSSDKGIKLLAAKDNRSFVVMETDNIIPGHLMRFEDIKDRLAEEYIDFNSDQKAKDIAKQYRTNIIEKKDSDKPQFENVRLSRIRTNDSIPQCLQNLIADMHRNGIFDGLTIPCKEDDNYFFGQLNSMDFALEVSDEEKASLRQPILSIYNELIFNQFLESLRKKYKVELDEQFIKFLNE